MDLFYLLSPLLGIVMRGLYFVVSNYGWAIILFTFLVRILMFPLSMKQQKSQARTSAYQPMIKEIQKKWANDRNKQNEEVQKFQQENGIKMSAGCLPMVINMLVLFGVIGVIQSPLQHILSIPQGELAAGYSIVNYHHPESNVLADTYTQQTILIDEIKANPELFIEGVDVVETLPQSDSTPSSAAQSAASGSASGSVSASGAGGDAGTPPGTTVHYAMSQESIDAIQKFDFTLNLFGWKIDLATAPDFGNFWTLVMPILSLLTMFGSQAIIMLFGGTGQQQGKVSMIVMTVIMGVMFAFFAFRVPLGFSLYYTVSNVVMTIQQLVLRKIYDPAKIREQVEAEIEAKRQEKKAKKKVTIKNDAGEVLDLDVPESELVRMRLQRARELDAEKYGELDAEAEAKSVAV